MSDSTTRLDYETFRKIAPDAHAALLALGKTPAAAGLDKGLIELIKLRVSQMNRCAFCLDYHLTGGRDLGVAAVKLDLVAAWADAGVFTEPEKAALGWAEALTLAAVHEIPEEAWEKLRAHFSETEAVFLTVAIGTINAWNRLGAGLRLPPLAARKPAA